MAKVYCFDSSSKTSVRDRTVYHYTSPDGLMSILKSAKVRFTDCQFFNDRFEYNHIHQSLLWYEKSRAYQAREQSSKTSFIMGL